jgi:hypothetical protein
MMERWKERQWIEKEMETEELRALEDHPPRRLWTVNGLLKVD